MKSLIKRLKNLWRWSEVEIEGIGKVSDQQYEVLRKSIPRIKKKLATIIPEKVVNPFEEENGKTN